MPVRYKVSREMAMRMAQMADDGVPVPEIAKKFQLSTVCVYENIDTIRPESPASRRKHAEKHRELLSVPWDSAVEEMAQRLASGNWHRTQLREYTQKWQCSRKTVRDIVIEASVKIHRPINPYYLSAIFIDCVESLRNIGAKAERACEFEAATSAYKAAGTLIAVIAKSSEKPLQMGEPRKDMTYADLVSQGWTPPPPEGLPAPFLDDPEKDFDNG